MKLLGKTQVTTIDLPDQIKFVVVCENGLVVLIIPPTLCVAGIVYGWLAHQWGWVLMGLFGLVSVVFWHLKGPVTKLFVTEHSLIASGKINRLTTDRIVIPAEEVKYLGFSTGGENDPSGLYASRGWRQTCLIPELGKKEAIAIADAIHVRFPRYQRQDESGIAFVFH
jgi:hypothetical protein